MKKHILGILIAILLIVVMFTMTACKKSVEQGPQGEAGITPTFKVENGDLLVSYDKGNTWTSLGHIQGADGESSQDENPQELDFYIKDDGTYSVAVGNAKYLSSINIPATYKGKPVTEIADEAFRNCSSLTSVVIPDSVMYIGYGAFSYCFRLTSFTVGENNRNYTSIDGNLYSKDGKTLIRYAVGKAETSFIIPDSVTTIGNYAFFGCSSLTSVVIPDSVTTIGACAFEYCSSLTSVVIGDSVTTIGHGAFFNCSRLTSVVIPDSVTTIGNSAFFGCSSLTSVVIPDSVTSIGYEAFAGCSSLTSVVIPDSVTTIGHWAFSGCDSLTGFTVGENNRNYTSIDGNLYSKDGKTLIQYAVGKAETSFIIPDSVTTIGYWAFDYCDSLTSVVIPDSVTTIGYWAFDDCSSLTDVYYTGSEAQWAEISIGNYNSYLTRATRHYNYVP